MTKPTEEQLAQAAVAIGQATTGCTPEERQKIKALYEKVQSFAESQKAKGVNIDRSAFFAAGLILHPEVANDAVKQAAVKYVDMDLLFVREKSASNGSL